MPGLLVCYNKSYLFASGFGVDAHFFQHQLQRLSVFSSPYSTTSRPLIWLLMISVKPFSLAVSSMVFTYFGVNRS
ncbi:hypothetical protein QQ054_21120, partial [Oscillatoria amoena NRMC-F 0135]|nr:hypothetical protein [Oscillatoria amoena NRMC-F 0135]